MSKETDAQYARSVDNVAYARSRCPESKKLCPKCGSEMKAVMFTVKYGSHKARACINLDCDYEEKVGGEL